MVEEFFVIFQVNIFMKKGMKLNPSMWILEQVETMKLGGNLINILRFHIIVDHSSPFISLVAFSIGQSLDKIPWQLLEFHQRLISLADIERSLRVDVLKVFLIFLIFFFHLSQGFSPFVRLRFDHQVMNKAIWATFISTALWTLQAKLGVEAVGGCCHHRKCL